MSEIIGFVWKEEAEIKKTNLPLLSKFNWNFYPMAINEMKRNKMMNMRPDPGTTHILICYVESAAAFEKLDSGGRLEAAVWTPCFLCVWPLSLEQSVRWQTACKAVAVQHEDELPFEYTLFLPHLRLGGGMTSGRFLLLYPLLKTKKEQGIKGKGVNCAQWTTMEKSWFLPLFWLFLFIWWMSWIRHQAVGRRFGHHQSPFVG